MEEVVSVIVPIYNAEKYLNRCIESIINQIYTKIEIILVNDGSTDKTKDICNTYKLLDNRIKVINQKNMGVSKARNRGIIESTGKYILFLDSDDWLERNAVQILHDSIIEGNYDLVIAGIILDFTDQSKDSINISLKNKTYNTSREYLEDFPKYRQCGIFGYSVNKIYKSEIIKKNNIFFDEYTFAEDLFYMFNILRYFDRIKIINNLLYHYVHNNPTSLSKSKRDELKTMNLIYDKTVEFLLSMDVYTVNEKYISNGYIESLSNYILNYVFKEKGKINTIRYLYKQKKINEISQKAHPNTNFYRIMNSLIKIKASFLTVIFLWIYEIVSKVKRIKGGIIYGK